MAIISQIKKILQTPEAQDLKKELSDSTRDVVEKVEATVKGVVKASGEEDQESGTVSFDTFLRVEVRVGTIISAEEVPKSDKLLKLVVDVGEKEPRQIISGIKNYFDSASDLVDRQAMFVTNLAPSKIMGLESNGMIFAVNDKDNFSLLEPAVKIIPGTRAQ